MRKKLRYSGILIPTDETIFSNRGSIQEAVRAKGYEVLKTGRYDFSYDPHYYTYNEFFIVN